MEREHDAPGDSPQAPDSDSTARAFPRPTDDALATFARMSRFAAAEAALFERSGRAKAV